MEISSSKRTSKFWTIFAVSLITSLSLLTVKHIKEDSPTASIRRLTEETRTVHGSCLHASRGIQEYYMDQDSIEFKLMDPIEDSRLDFLKDFQETGQWNYDLLVDYSIKWLPFAFFIILFPFSIIGWFICCCCSCCPSCCCKQRNKKQTCCKTCSLFTTIIMFLTIASICFFGFDYTYRWLEAIFGTACSFFQIIKILQDGENTSARIKFLGVNGWEKKLMANTNEINTTYNSIHVYSDDIGTELRNQKTIYTNRRDGDFQGQSYEISIKDPENVNYPLDFQPNYIFDIGSEWILGESFTVKRFGPSQNSDSMLSNLERELQLLIDQLIDKLQDHETTVRNKLDSNDPSLQLNSAREPLITVKEQLDSLEDTLEEPWKDVEDHILFYIPLVLTIFFSVFSVISILMIAWIILFAYKVKCMKCPLHCLWNFCTWYMIYFLLIGSIWGMAGIIVIDSVGVFQWFWSEEKLRKGDVPVIGEFSDYLLNCMYGDQTLASVFDWDDITDYGLFEIDKIENEINSVIPDTTTFPHSDQNGSMLMEKYKESILIDPSKIMTDEVKQKFLSIKKYTKNDLWGFTNADCDGKTIKIQFSWGEADGSCFKFGAQASNDDIEARYGLTNKDKIIGFFDAYKDWIIKNNKYIDEELHAADYDKIFDDTKNIAFEIPTQIQSQIKQITGQVRGLLDKTKDTSIYNDIGCKFLGSGMNILLLQWKNLGDKLKLFGILWEVMSCCIVVGTITWIIALNRFHYVPKNIKEKAVKLKDVKSEEVKIAEIENDKIENNEKINLDEDILKLNINKVNYDIDEKLTELNKEDNVITIIKKK